MHTNAAATFPVLDLGHVRLIDLMGDDETPYHYARRSYRDDSAPQQSPRGLTRYCARKRHDSIFEPVVLHLEFKMPIYVARQWMRYRSASYSEFSQRYSDVPMEFQRTAPDAWRLQDPDNKQGSAGTLPVDAENDYFSLHTPEHQWDGCHLTDNETSVLKFCDDAYRGRLSAGIAREQARKDLPLSTYSTFRQVINLRNLFHLLEERLPQHGPQSECRSYAEAVAHKILAPLFPICWEAFLDYRLESMTLSRMEILILYSRFTGNAIISRCMTDRETKDFVAKLVRLGLAAAEGGDA